MSLLDQYAHHMATKKEPFGHGPSAEIVKAARAHIAESIAVAKQLEPYLLNISVSEHGIQAGALAILLAQAIVELAEDAETLEFGLAGATASISVMTETMFKLKKQQRKN